MACTHYPLIQPEIAAYYKNKIAILNTAEIVAQYTKDILVEKKLCAKELTDKHVFYVSDFTASFEKSTQIFFKEKIHLELKNIWS